MISLINKNRWWKEKRVEWIVLISLLLIAGCSRSGEISIPEEISGLENLTVYGAETEPEYEISLEPEAVFGDTEDIFLGSWLSATVDDRGRVFVADHQETVLHLYNPDGTYNRQIGQEGEGPGEYRNLGPMRIDNRYLHVMDRNLNRITRYYLDTFEVEGNVSISVEQGGTEGPVHFPFTFFIQNDSTYLLQTRMAFPPRESGDIERTIEGRKMKVSTGELSDSTVFSFPESEALIHRENNSMMVMGTPYNRKSILRVRNGQVFYGWSEDFLIKIYDDEGTYERAIYYPYQNPPLVRDEIIDRYSDRGEQMLNIVRNADMPATMPVFNDFFTDDEGRIWVKKLTENSDETEYVVLANTGELLATFTWPSATHIQEIKNGFLYVLETEVETGLSKIVKYRVSSEKI